MAIGAGASAADPVPPFVAGFDRFGRHAQIDAATAGRLLVSELSCTACHASDDQALAPKSGPRLDGVADRLSETWVRQFLNSPQTVKPGTTMPDVLAGVTDDERAATLAALLAFLSTQHQPWPNIRASGANPVLHRFWERGDAANGRRLYHTVGCVACHQADADYETVETKPSPLEEMLSQLDPDEIAEMGLAAAVRPVNPVPHPDLPAKYSRQSLTYFLLQPELVRPSGRMPSLKLKVVEAADIAAWLLRDQKQPLGKWAERDTTQVERGRRLFSELRCANCHVARGGKAKPAHALASLDPSSPRSCIGEPTAGLPHYPLETAQIKAVRSALADTSTPSTTAAANSQFLMLQLNCYGCHERDGRGGVGRNLRSYFETVGNVDVGDEGRLPPPLRGVGGKLETGWLKKVLSGTGDVRPHMQARMPQFPKAAVASLPDLLTKADRQKRESPSELGEATKADSGSDSAAHITDDDTLAAAGRKLMDVGCVQCHLFRGEALPGVVGVDLIGVPDRVRPDWFRQFLLDPGALKPRTRMPSFFPGGKSQNPEVLGGDPEQQIAAMWAYLKAGDKQPLPTKIEEARSQDFELKPTDRPILLRTFMPQAGTHAIAVGLPAGVHYAFDAQHLRLAQAWKGRFLDAQGTWFSRFALPAEPLGSDVVALPPGPALAWLKDAEQTWPTGDDRSPGNRFGGYRLDADGVPTFLYEIGPVHVEDRIAPDGKDGLKRQFVVKLQNGGAPPDADLWLRANAGTALKMDGSTSINADGLAVMLFPTAAGELRTSDQETEWLVPLTIGDEPVTVEVRYRW